MKKAALHNLGCKVNAYETEAMLVTEHVFMTYTSAFCVNGTIS